jgi:tetratricopeptide (TPR) repeat protein
MTPLLLALLLSDAASSMAAGDKALLAKDFRAALFAYQDAVRDDPASLPAALKLAGTYQRMGHDEEAIAWFKRALQLDPANGVASDGLAAARERLAALSTLQANDPAAREKYAAAVRLINEKKYEEALPLLDQALRLRPRYAVALVARGSARMGLSQYPAAAADYEAARAADPSLAAPLFGLAEAWRAMGQPGKSAGFYRDYAASGAADVQPQLRDYALRSAQALSSQ